MIVRRYRSVVFSRIGVLSAVAALFLFSGPIDGIILYRTGDPIANTTAPTGTLANSGWQYEGIFGESLGTPIAPHFFITAFHVGSYPKLVYRGADYTVVGSFKDPASDLSIYQVSEPFTTFAPLYTGSDEVGKHLVAIGRGTQRGGAVTSGGDLRGWNWGQTDKVQRWGENTVAAIKQRLAGGADTIYALFDKNGLPNECHLSVGDSGGAVFLDDGGIWKLGGINYDVDGAFYTGPNGIGSFIAALFDERGFYDENRHFVSGSTPVPSGFYATRISSRLEWIDSVVEPHLANISTRATVGTGDQVAIAGFIVVGTPGQSRRVIMRGLGSSLKVNGVPLPGRLANPLIELHNATGTTMAINDNWRSSAQAAEIQSRDLAPTDDAEAVLVATLPVGAYTAVLRGVNGSSGIGLIEVYDVGTYGNARLLNLSARGFVGVGDGVLIGGLIVRSLSQQLLVRAIGPDLAALGVTGALQDPVLELHDSNGAILSSNNNWQNASNSSAISAAGFTPGDPRDAAILLTPGPGQFTAIIRGTGTTTGVALLEAYLLE